MKKEKSEIGEFVMLTTGEICQLTYHGKIKEHLILRKATQKEISNKDFDLYFSSGSELNLKSLSDWCLAQISAGKTNFNIDISWGYYNDIDGLNLIAK